MRLTFVESAEFTRTVYDYFGSDAEYAALQDALIANPARGDVMPGCGGLRKVRWRDIRRGKGTRGGLRVIYLHVPDAQRILFLDVYDKDEADDLTSAERRHLASLAESYREEIRAAKSRRESGR
jgi:hypothetical protein